MAYYTALELRDENNQPAGKWHYTRTDGAGTSAIGYCSPWEHCKTCAEKHCYPADPECPECGGKGIWKKADACPGHDSFEEAEKHYHEYLADTARWSVKKNEWPKEKCDHPECNNEGTNRAMTDGRWRDKLMCAEHANRDSLFAAIAHKNAQATHKA